MILLALTAIVFDAHYYIIDDFLNTTAEWEPFKFRLVTEEELLNCILSIGSCAVGIDGISINMIKACLPHCLKPLVNILNSSLETSSVPDLWKMALITPLPKVSNPASLSELRPISILPAASKILEKIVKGQILEFLKDKNVIPKFQSGFRSNFSCATALLKITSDITQAFDEGHSCPAVLIDMTKAFDSLNIELLLAKLSHYGIDTDGWFAGYLHNRLSGSGKMVRCQCRIGGMLGVGSRRAPSLGHFSSVSLRPIL